MFAASGIVWLLSVLIFFLGATFCLFRSLRRQGLLMLAGSVFVWILSMGMCAVAMPPSVPSSVTPKEPREASRDLPALPPAPALERERSKGKWTVTLQSRSPMDDTMSVGYLLKAEDPHGIAEHRIPRLFVACQEKKTIAYVDTRETVHSEIGDRNDHPVRIRIDDEQARSEHWRRSTDETALFSPDAVSLARRLAKSRRFLLEFTPLKRDSNVIEFQTAGVDQVIREIAQTCGWKP